MVRRRPERVSKRRVQLLLRAHDAAVPQLRRAVHLRPGARSRSRRVTERSVIPRLNHRHLEHCRTGTRHTTSHTGSCLQSCITLWDITSL